jgi:hypothetical protein
MAKELPYFKFFPGEWLSGDITLLDMKEQGVFINLCAYYWKKDCSIRLANAKQRFSMCLASLELLLKNDIVKVDANDYLVIEFLNEQYDLFTDMNEQRINAGRLGGLAKAKQALSKRQASAKQTPIYKDKELDKDKEINISFDIFWDLYEKKVGEKKKLIAKWEKLTDEERQTIINYIPKYKESQPDKRFRKNPDTFFNNKSWNDELIGLTDNIKAKSIKEQTEIR